MTNKEFLDEIATAFDKSKRNEMQELIYESKLNKYDDRQRRQIHNWLLENCKYYPKIADVIEAAKELGFEVGQREYRPHVWQPTGCARCGGSGLVAAFYEQDFKLGEAATQLNLRLVAVMPYHESGDRWRQMQEEHRSVYRCDCVGGSAHGLDKGIRQWRGKEQPSVLHKDWGAA